MRRLVGTLLLGGLLPACSGGDGSGPPAAGADPEVAAEVVEATSLLGRPLVRPSLPRDVQEEREARLAEARAEHERNPDSRDARIWLGRRTAYLGRYGEAIEIYGEAIERDPDNPRLYRHRGHRYVTVRRLDEAVRDLEHAAGLIAGMPEEIEPDGLPNALNTPTSSLHSNVWYHLGLAYYLLGDLDNAERCYRRCLDFSGNPDMLSATSHWLYMTLRRQGKDADAQAVLQPIHADMEIIENHAYHELLLMYRGERSPEQVLSEGDGTDRIDSATRGYGVGNWHFYNGRREEARAIFRKILAGQQWAAFGYIAAEADVARDTASR
jgi:tetratricopeptide (TPR) repeat protein